jgi:hypothetical protein
VRAGHYGRSLPTAFRAAGLVDVHCDVGAHLMRAAESAPINAPVLRRTRERALELGLASAAEFDKVLAELDDPGSGLWTYSPILVATRGRRPHAPVAAQTHFRGATAAAKQGGGSPGKAEPLSRNDVA